jgi:hypothetical protein
MLRQNSELRPHRIWNWTLPAWHVTREDGTRFMTCPNAGICAQYCYARNGTYLFRNVLAAHTANLDRVLNNPEQWQSDMIEELKKKKYRPTGQPRLDLVGMSNNVWLVDWVLKGGSAIRIHDSGDFFADWYLDLWIGIAQVHPDVMFYAYTKEIELCKSRQYPDNFHLIYSTGGLQDHLIDPENDRHADVFPSTDAMEQAGYLSQDVSDLYAILLPTTKVGITANNIRHFNKKLAGRRFSEVVPVRLRMKHE